MCVCIYTIAAYINSYTHTYAYRLWRTHTHTHIRIHIQVVEHPMYEHDSVVSDEICFDLMKVRL